MGNTLKSVNSRKSYNLQHTREVFKDTASLEPVASEGVRAEKDDCKRGLMKWGLPKRADAVYHRAGYSLGYDYERRVPLWVIEKLDKSNYEGDKVTVKHNVGLFYPDIEMSPFSATNEDYIYDDMKTKDYHKGQLAETANHSHNTTEEFLSCYCLSNTVPQNVKMNEGFLNYLKSYIRDLALKHNTWVITGPLFEKTSHIEEPFRRMGYPVVGENNVASPTHIYKIIIAEISTRVYLSCMVVPNAVYTEGDYRQIDLNYLEELSGLQFPIIKMVRTFDLFEIFPFDTAALKLEETRERRRGKKSKKKAKKARDDN